MGYPLIILGAGASFDCQNNQAFADSHVLNQWQPPLTKDLFDTSRFYDILNRYQPQVSNLAAYVTNRLKFGKETFEEILTDLRVNKISLNSDLTEQLVALRFYIADLFTAISKNYFRTVNNYQALLQIIYSTGRKACFVDFNYDLLLEKSFFINLPKSTNDYINSEIKIIKLHGACNWYFFRPVNGFEKKGSYEFSIQGSKFVLENENKKYEITIKDVEISKHIGSIDNGPTTKITYLPALALPLTNKVDYVCPDTHIEALKTSLPQIDKIVLIGWRAGDPYLVKLIKELIGNRSLPLALVCGQNSKSEIINNLGPLAGYIKLTNEAGFSSFLQSNQCEQFLN